MKTRARAAGLSVVLGGAAVLGFGLLGGGCLQILGDEGPFVLGSGGGGGAGGAAGEGGAAGTAGNGGTGGMAGECEPTKTEPCYTGPMGTENVGICVGGMRTCGADGKWGACEGEVTPQMDEDPTAVGDEKCDGFAPGESLCAKLFGDEGYQYGKAVAADPVSGHSVIAGTFSGAMDFGTNVLIGSADVFVAKVDADCKPLWAVQFGGTEDANLGSVTVDSAGDVYATGSTSIAFMFDNMSIDIGTFLIKLDGTSGKALWARTCKAGKFNSSGNSVAVDKSGSVAIGGNFTTSIDCGKGILNSSGSSDGFVAKFDASTGTPIWNKGYGYGTVSYQYVTAIEFDPVGDLILAGTFQSGINLGGANIAAADDTDIFVAKVSSIGDHIWSDRYGGGFVQYVKDIAVDKLGAVLVTGDFNGKIDLPGKPDILGSGEPDGFIFKLSASGNALWGWSFGLASGKQGGTSVDVDTDDNVLLAGSFEKEMILNGGPTIKALGTTDGFIAKILGETGGVVWSRSFKDSPAAGGRITTDGVLMITGAASASFNDTIDLGTGPLDPQGTDAYIIRFAP